MTNQTASRRKRAETPEREWILGCNVHRLNSADLERIPSEDGRRINDRFRCRVCIEYGSDDESKTFTPNNKSSHLRTAKHQASLGYYHDARELEERELARAQNECTQAAHSVLLPLPNILLPTSQDERTSNMFQSFRRLGLDYLDENGEQLTFSAGTDLDENENNQAQTHDEAEILTSECSDAESDVESRQPGWTMRDSGLNGYWPYPSKTVSVDLEVSVISVLTK